MFLDKDDHLMLDDVLDELDDTLYLEKDDLDPNTLGQLEHLLRRRKCNWVDVILTEPLIPNPHPFNPNQNVSTVRIRRFFGCNLILSHF